MLGRALQRFGRSTLSSVVSKSKSTAPAAWTCSGARSFSSASADDAPFAIYTGDKKVDLVTGLEFVRPDDLPTYPAFRVTDEEGNIVEGATDPELGEELCLKIYKTMVNLNNMDKVLYEAQRQVRVVCAAACFVYVCVCVCVCVCLSVCVSVYFCTARLLLFVESFAVSASVFFCSVFHFLLQFFWTLFFLSVDFA